jgi:hypothetical protein
MTSRAARPDGRGDQLRHVVDDEAEAGQAAEARRWMEQALDQNLQITSDTEATKDIHVALAQEREKAWKEKEAQAAKAEAEREAKAAADREARESVGPRVARFGPTRRYVVDHITAFMWRRRLCGVGSPPPRWTPCWQHQM